MRFAKSLAIDVLDLLGTKQVSQNPEAVK